MENKSENWGVTFITVANRVRDDLRRRHEDDIDMACAIEREQNIDTAARAMLDARLDEDTVVLQLAKFWDLRLSEAEQFVEAAKALLDSGRPLAPIKLTRIQ